MSTVIGTQYIMSIWTYISYTTVFEKCYELCNLYISKATCTFNFWSIICMLYKL